MNEAKKYFIHQVGSIQVFPFKSLSKTNIYYCTQIEQKNIYKLYTNFVIFVKE